MKPAARAMDLNCDLGEGAGDDAGLMALVTSANIACGGHAGDERSMAAALELARRHGVAAGAHPGFEDPEHFGRRELRLSSPAVAELVARQVGRLLALAAEAGVPLRHVKPHGGLYNLAARDAETAAAVAEGVRRAGPGLILVGLAGGRLLAAGRERGLRVAAEAFADRAYRADGSLQPRGAPGALLGEAAAVEQVLRLVREGRIRAADGTELAVEAQTLCLHGDSPGALGLARRLREELLRAGVEVRALP